MDFLRLVLPGDDLGFKALRIPAKKVVGGKQVTFERQGCAQTAEQAARMALEASAAGHNVFMCMASQREAPLRVPRTDKTGATLQYEDGRPQMRTVFRRQANAHYLKALFLDLDVDADNDRKFHTSADAVFALKHFCRDIGLPRPLIVMSGPAGGLHCYWPFAEAVPVAEWLPIAQTFKQLCLVRGFNIDATVPADTARVLRVVGTVRNGFVVAPVDTYVPAQLEFGQYASLLKAAADKYGVTPTGGTTNTLGLPGGPAPVDLGDNTGRQYDGLPVSIAEVTKHCQALRTSYETGGSADQEPVWYANVGFAAYTDDPEETAFKFSSAHPDFAEESTRQKMLQWKDKMSGPPTCAKLESLRFSGGVSACEGCVHKGKIKSPIVLGRYVEEAEPPTVLDIDENGSAKEVTLANPPHPFKRSAKGTIYYEVGGEDGVNRAVEICPFDLYPVRLMDYENGGERTVVWRAQLPHQGVVDIPIPQRMHSAEPGRLMGELGARGVTIPPKHGKVMQEFMSAYIHKLQLASPANTHYATMGWRDNQFVTPDGVITTTGTQPFPFTPAFKKDMEGMGAKAGTLRGQLDALSYYSKAQNTHLQLPMLMVMGSPLLPFTNVAGLIVSLYGTSGCGKSTAMEMANSMWGNPELLQLNCTKKGGYTDNALYHTMHLRKNIHCVLDEVSQVDSERLGGLAYTISMPTGRGRMRDGETMARTEIFNLIAGMTANKSVMMSVAGQHSNTEAQMLRIIEFYIKPSPHSAKLEADTMIRNMRQHYGHLGPYVMEYIVKHQDKMRSLVQQLIVKIDKDAAIKPAERYWSAGFACGIAFAVALRKLGAIDWDLDALYQNAMDHISSMRGTVVEQNTDAVGLAKDMITEFGPNTLHIAPPVGNLGVRPLVVHRGPLYGRFEIDKNRLYLSRSAIKTYCLEHTIDMRSMAQELITQGILIRVDAKKCLGANTDYDTVQSSCWLFDLGHTAMRGAAVEIVQHGVVAI